MNLEAMRHRYLRHVVAPVLRGLGPRFGTGLARRLAQGLFEMNGPGRRRAEARLRAALPGARDAQIAGIAAASYEHFARFWVEALFIPGRLGGVSWRRFVRVADEPRLRALADSGGGCLLAAAYHGNPAAGACALGHLFRPVHVVVDFLAQPILADWQRALYAQPHVRPIERRAAAAAVPRVLAGGGAVLLVGEHERPRGRCVETRFLGRRVRCYPTLGRLARWYDVPVGVVTCRREGGPFGFALELEDVIEPRAGVGQEEAIVRRAMAGLERAVLRSPEQYAWSMPVGDREGRRAAEAARAEPRGSFWFAPVANRCHGPAVGRNPQGQAQGDR